MLGEFPEREPGDESQDDESQDSHFLSTSKEVGVLTFCSD